MHRNTFKYKLCKLYLTITRIIKSLAKVGHYHLGTHVCFRGVEYTIADGCHYDAYAKCWCWPLRRVHTPRLMVQNNLVYAHESEITKVLSFENIWYDATYWWKWYKRNWLSIDARNMTKGKKLVSTRMLGGK